MLIIPTSSFAPWISPSLSGNVAECRSYKLYKTLKRLAPFLPHLQIPKSERSLDHFCFWVSLRSWSFRRDIWFGALPEKVWNAQLDYLLALVFFSLAMNNLAFKGDGHLLLPEEAKLFIPSHFATIEGDGYWQHLGKCFPEHHWYEKGRERKKEMEEGERKKGKKGGGERITTLDCWAGNGTPSISLSN